MNGRGVLFLVVGASGVGKDSLIAGARRHLGDDPRFVFPQRVITRPVDDGAELHRPVDEATFERMREGGAFLLDWRAHELRYGIPVAVSDDLSDGRSAVINVSRGIVGEAIRRHPLVRVLQIKAPSAELRRRLEARGREDETGIMRRLDRAEAYLVEADHVRVIVNHGPLERSVETFIRALKEEVALTMSEQV